METKAELMFEVTWEACNKVGGIYTVVKSKAAAMAEQYKQGYYVIGPYFPLKAQGEFEEKPTPEAFREPFDRLKSQGIVCRYGNWLIKGEPQTILVDFSGFTSRKDQIKTEFWNSFKIDSLNTEYYSYDEPIIWGYACGMVIEVIAAGKKAVAQCHEWLAGGALLYLKMKSAPIATVFTTHATMLGRTLASSNDDLYAVLNSIDPDKEAYSHGIQAKHLTEVACARNADVFTTVSEITAIEAEKILGRKADFVLANGLDINKFPTFEEASIKHQLYKRKIKEFILYYFFPYYSFDLDNTLIYFLCGRYEFRDKGVDVFIKALAKMNQQLKSEKSSQTIVAFFWIPANIRGIKPELLENKTYYEDIREQIHDSQEEIQSSIIYRTISQRKWTDADILAQDELFDLKKKVMKLTRPGKPPLSTHDLFDEPQDPILGLCKSLGLNNEKEDRVKIVFYPIYLTGADRLLDLGYYEAMQGSHLGVFPSYYEPWGYTPLEAAALGVSSVTTDLAGFGRFIRQISVQKKTPGIYVLDRFNKGDDEIVQGLSDIMLRFATLTKELRIKNKIEAQHLAGHCDWRNLSRNYFSAHNEAIKRRLG